MRSDLERLQKIRDREAHGIPPERIVSTDEVDSDVRFLLGLAEDASALAYIECDRARDATAAAFWYSVIEAAMLPPRRKRCTECGGEGEISFVGANCVACNGTGYQEASP